MKIWRYLRKGLKEVCSYARWVFVHYDEIEPVIDLIRRLVAESEKSGKPGADKRNAVVKNVALRARANSPGKAVTNLLIERAVADLDKDRTR